MAQFAYDDEPCPNRFGGLAHHGLPHCAECGTATVPASQRPAPIEEADCDVRLVAGLGVPPEGIVGVPAEPAPPREHAPEAPKFAPVPRYLRSEYDQARRGQLGAGLGDRDAQALVALRHGLHPTAGLPWTLQEVARLEAVAAWHAAGRLGS